MENQANQKLFSTQNLVKTALLSAVALILFQFKFKLPIFPSFLSIDVSDMACIVGMITICPAAGFVIAILKNLLDALIFGSTTGYVGEFSNMIISSAYILPLAICLKHRRDLKSICIAAGLGVISMAIVGAFTNYFIMVPLYARVFGMEVSQIVGMGTAIYSGITDLFTLIIFSIIPFNLFKGTIVATVSITFLKSVYPALKLLRTKSLG
ncbi:MAG: hypothetical protein BEN19_00700 [Epulopiscium sp. Nuni2H_MBin003]|nr:MAG: hypothetical protein BEN19_00700 [Epulopiscium sp. Nuni2H_MBin003]